jgi:DNA-directed RNA polymerase specialized sigma24 family protein
LLKAVGLFARKFFQRGGYSTQFERPGADDSGRIKRIATGDWDFSQDVVLKVHEKLASFDGQSKFSTWVHTIAKHTVLDTIKHEEIQNEVALTGDDNRGALHFERRTEVENITNGKHISTFDPDIES